jgi:protein-tyrosine phosphatase
MVDIHSHILPGIDDGPKTLEDSVTMVKMAAKSGTTDIVATPHSDLHFKFQPELVEARIAEVSEACGRVLRIYRGCDFHLHWDNIQDSLEHPTRYTINGKRYLLVEFSELLIPKSTDEVFGRMQAVGIIPVVTHPERNGLLHARLDTLKAWTDSGVRVQVTAQSFTGRFGKAAKSIADELMKRNLVHIIASDAHDTHHRPPVLTEAYAYIAKHYGDARAELLFKTNPGATLTGEPIEIDLESAPEPRKWYQF